MTEEEFADLSDEEITEIYGPLFPIVRAFEEYEGREFTSGEAGLLVIFAKWLKDNSDGRELQ